MSGQSVRARVEAEVKQRAKSLRHTRAGRRLDLERRVADLEAEVQECRQLNLRLAELTDIVTELLVPVAHRDEARLAELLERYQKGL
ncbi:MAG: DUF6752 domain-containing protein [Nocardioides sp.]